MYRGHVLGAVVRTLRDLRSKGAGAYDLLAHLQPRFPDSRAVAVGYINAAFTKNGLRMHTALRGGMWAHFDRDNEVFLVADQFIDAAKDDWMGKRFPELIRTRDYFAFLEFAVAHKLYVIVCDATPLAAPLIGVAGHRCYDGTTFVVSRETPPHEGCVAADPEDTRLRDGLAAYPGSGLPYAAYVARLAEEGLHVASAEEGYAVLDASGCRLYQGYRLHGVYDSETGRSAWTGKAGERLRGEINERLGHELVLKGPHDD